MSRGVRNGDYVLVTWVDSTVVRGWSELDDLETVPLVQCETVGRLLNRKDRVIRIISTVGDNNSAIQVIAIPQGCVQTIIRLGECE